MSCFHHGLEDCHQCQSKTSDNESYKIRPSIYGRSDDYRYNNWTYERPAPTMSHIDSLEYEIRELKHQISKLEGFIGKLMDVFLPGHKK